MFRRIFGKPKVEPSTLNSLEKLNETLEMLDKKESVLQKKIAAEMQKAREYYRAKNKRAAVCCMKKKKLYENEVEQIGNFQLRIHDQMILLEGAKATTETVSALRGGALAMKAINRATKIDEVDKTMEDVIDQSENMKQIQESLSGPFSSVGEFDEEELEAELQDLEGAELEEQLLKPATTTGAMQDAPPTHAATRSRSQPTSERPAPQRPAPQAAAAPTTTVRTSPPVVVTEADELAALQAEMAL